MNRRAFLRMTGIGISGGLLGACAHGGGGGVKKPNVVFIIADDPGYHDFNYDTQKIAPTPNLDHIYNGGTRFTNAYVTCFLCSPSRAGIMTARYQNRFGYEHNPSHRRVTADNFGLDIREVTMGNVLQTAGYTTGYIGKWHLGFTPDKHPFSRGFDEFFGFLGGGQDYYDRGKDPWDPVLRGREPVDEKEYTTHAYTREAVDFINRHAHDANPFYVCVAYNAVHAPWQAPAEDVMQFPDVTPPTRRMMAAMIKVMDDGIGDIQRALETNGLADDTMVIFLGDNGGTKNTDNSPLRGFKGMLQEGGIRVPMAIQWNGRVPAGTAFDGTTSSMDIFPTVAAAAGGTMPTDRVIDGVNLLPYLEGEKSGNPHDVLFWRYGWAYALRKGDWKLIRVGKPEEKVHRELYHLTEDIHEDNNLVESRPDKVQELETALDELDAQMVEPYWSNYSMIEWNLRKEMGLKETRDPDNLFEKLDTLLPPHPTR